MIFGVFNHVVGNAHMPARGRVRFRFFSGALSRLGVFELGFGV